MQKLSYGIIALFIVSIDPSVSIAQSLGMSTSSSMQNLGQSNVGQLRGQRTTTEIGPGFSQSGTQRLDSKTVDDAIRLYEGRVRNNSSISTPTTQMDVISLYEKYIGSNSANPSQMPPGLIGNEGYAHLLKFYDKVLQDVFEDDGRHRIDHFKVNGSFDPSVAIRNGETSILYTDIVKLAKSVALVTATKNISHIDDGTLKLTTKPDDLCEEVKFSGSLIAGHCTAFLAFDQQTVVTANHCIPDQGDYSIAFGFSSSTSMPARSVFQIDHTAKVLQNTDNDIAILRLNRPVPSDIAEPLKMNLLPDIKKGTRVGIIGHPMGMGQIVEFGDESRVKDIQMDRFLTNNDAFHGNSGSPVFNQETLAVEGVLQRGQYDLVKDIDRNCTVIRTVDANGADNSGLVLGFQTALMSSKAVELYRAVK